MVQCSIPCGTSSCRQLYNDCKIVFFAITSISKAIVFKCKYRTYTKRKNNIKKCQNESWIAAISRGNTDGVCEHYDCPNIRTFIHHFHPSVIQCDDNGEYILKVGASPTLYLKKFAMDNERFKEETYLQRNVGSTEDIQCIHNYEINDNIILSTPKSNIVTLTRDIRNNKRRHDVLQLEDAEKRLE